VGRSFEVCWYTSRVTGLTIRFGTSLRVIGEPACAVNLALLFVIVGMFGGSPILGNPRTLHSAALSSTRTKIHRRRRDPRRERLHSGAIRGEDQCRRFFRRHQSPAGTVPHSGVKARLQGHHQADIILNVQDALAIAFTLPIGSIVGSGTVEGGVSMVNSQTAGLGTVVDHTYVENMPSTGVRSKT